MKKIFCILLAFSTVLSAAASITSCGDNTAQSDESQLYETETGTDSSSEETESIYPDLGEKNFEANKFNIIYCSTQLGYAWPYEAEEETGDLVNDAVFRRDITLEDKYNTDIVYIDTGTDENVAGYVRTAAAAGDKAYDLAINHMFYGVNAVISEHGLYNFNSLPYVDYEQPWWAQGLGDQLAVNGVLLLNVSDMIYDFCDCIYFNKKLFEDYHLENDPYQLTESGTWTWDNLIVMAQQVSNDLNGDGKYDENDVYGYSISMNPITESSWVCAAGLTIASHLPDGGITLDNVSGERMADLVDKMNGFIHNGNYCYIPQNQQKESIEDMKMFINNQVVFMENYTSMLPQMRDVETDFGIVPVPKLDEFQSSYGSMAITQMMMLPATLDDPEFIGFMLESLAMESHRTLNPAVYEISFSEKYLRDEYSYKMFEIIRTTDVYDFNWNYGDGNEFAYIMRNLTRSKSDMNIASFYQKNVKGIQRTLDKVYNQLLTYYD